MKNILVNFYNQTAAGPKNIAMNFIAEALESLEPKCKNIFIIIPDSDEYSKMYSNSTVKFLKIKKRKTFFSKAIFRFYLDLIFIPIFIKKNNIQSFLAFGNYLISPISIKKIVLLHHPYLVDNTLLNKLPLKDKIFEKLRRSIFYFTNINANSIIVQSTYMEKKYNEVWSSKNSKKAIVIHNPISGNFNYPFTIENLKNVNLERSNEKEIKVLYVSRYYPHKNHSFILKVARELKSTNIVFYVTLDRTIEGVNGFLEEVRNEELNIINIGEINQKDLEYYYKRSHIFFFPSKSETFGNPLIEAMKYGLPILVPNISYAKSVVGKAGIYYDVDDIDNCITKMNLIILNWRDYHKYSLRAFEQFRIYPNSKKWFRTYLDLLCE